MRVQPEIIVQRLASHMPPSAGPEDEEEGNKQNDEDDQNLRTQDEQQISLNEYRPGVPGTSHRTQRQSWRWTFGRFDILKHERKTTAISRNSSSKTILPLVNHSLTMVQSTSIFNSLHG